MTLPFPLHFDPSTASSSRFVIIAEVIDEMTDPNAFLEMVRENAALMLRDIGRFAGLVRQGAVVRSRMPEAGPRSIAVEVEFDRPRPDLMRMLINGLAGQGYDFDASAFFRQVRVEPRDGGPLAQAEPLLPPPPPFSLTDAEGAPILGADLPRYQDYAVYGATAGGYDRRGQDLMMVLSNLSESCCLADPNQQPVIPDMVTPIAWPAMTDGGEEFPARLGISRLVGGEFAVHTIAATIAAASLAPVSQLTLVIEPYEH